MSSEPALNGHGSSYTSGVGDRTRRSRGDRGARGGSAQSHLNRWTLELLRRDAQALDRNDSIARVCVDALADLVIGPKTAVLPQSGDAGFDTLARDRFGEWAEACGHDGVSSLWDIAQGCIAAACYEGDRLVNLLKAGSVQPIETELLANPNDTADHQSLINGLELESPGGRVAAYWIDEWQADGSFRKHQPRRHDAANVILISSPRSIRKGLRRGEPLLQSVARRLEIVDEIFGSTSIAIAIGAETPLLVKRKSANGSLAGFLGGAETDGNEDTYTDDNDGQRTLEPGMMWGLEPDEDVTQISPSFPQQNLTEWQLLQIRIAAADVGLPLSVVLFHMDKAYSAARSELQIAWTRTVEPWQVYLERQLVRPIYRWWAAREIARGDLPAVDGWRRLAVRHRPMPLLDPEKDAKASGTAITLGLSTREREVQRFGFNTAEEVDRQLAIEQQRQRDLGVIIGGLPGSTVAPAIVDNAGNTSETDEA